MEVITIYPIRFKVELSIKDQYVMITYVDKNHIHRTVVLNKVEYIEEDGIYNPINKQSSHEEMGGTYVLGKDPILYPMFNII